MLFNEYFSKQCTVDDSNAMLPDMDRIFNNENDLRSINVTEQDVKDQIQILNINKSFGPDGISPKLLVEGGQLIISTLTKLFNQSLKQK